MIALCTAALMTVLTVASAGDVWNLGDADFNRIDDQDLVLVKFYAPWWAGEEGCSYVCVTRERFINCLY